MKRKSMIGILVFVIIANIFLSVPVEANVNAASKTEQLNVLGDAYKSGNYIYYSYNMDGNRMGIYKMNVKNKKVSKVIDHKNNGKYTNGFSDLMVKGNYIYCNYDLYPGTGDSFSCIYRISKNGKSKKRLDYGNRPVVIGNWIYYIKHKVKTTTYYGVKTTSTVPVGIYKMKLNGSKKTRLSKRTNIIPHAVSYNNNKIVYTSDKKSYQMKLNGKISSYNFAKSNITPTYDSTGSMISSITKGNWVYYIGEDGLYRQLKNGTNRTLLSIYYPGEVTNFLILGNYIMVKGWQDEYDSTLGYTNPKFYVSCLNLDGSDINQLVSWWAGE